MGLNNRNPYSVAPPIPLAILTLLRSVLTVQPSLASSDYQVTELTLDTVAATPSFLRHLTGLTPALFWEYIDSQPHTFGLNRVWDYQGDKVLGGRSLCYEGSAPFTVIILPVSNATEPLIFYVLRTPVTVALTEVRGNLLGALVLFLLYRVRNN